MVDRCRAQNDQIATIIEIYFPEKGLGDTRNQFLKDRLDYGHFSQTQLTDYLMALRIFFSRLSYKQQLQDIGDRYPHILNEDSLLKMYYLAHQNRWSCFFLLDDFFRGHLLQKIEDIAATYQLEKSDTINQSVIKIIDSAIKSKSKQF